MASLPTTYYTNNNICIVIITRRLGVDEETEAIPFRSLTASESVPR